MTQTLLEYVADAIKYHFNVDDKSGRENCAQAAIDAVNSYKPPECEHEWVLLKSMGRSIGTSQSWHCNKCNGLRFIDTQL